MFKLALPLMLFALSVLADDQVVFRGVPSVRLFSTPERDDRQKLEGEDAAKAECVVVQRGRNKYVWQSRSDAPLNRIDTPQFTYFVHADGLGYIKVYTGERSANTSSVEYVESITRGFEVITYWGRVQNTR